METDLVLHPNTVRNRPSFVEQELVDIFALRAFVFPSATLANCPWSIELTGLCFSGVPGPWRSPQL